MARYADIDKFLHIVPVDELGNTDFITIEKCLTQASADVAPRAELAREIFAEIKEIILLTAAEKADSCQKMQIKGKNGDYFKGGRATCETLYADLNELEKKYTGEQTDGN